MKIAGLLQPREYFSPEQAGALALFAYETAKLSRFKDDITIYGPQVDASFEEVEFSGLSARSFFLQSHSKAYVQSFIRQVKDNPPDIIEVYNRPRYVPWLKEALPQSKILLSVHNDPLTMAGLRTMKERE